MTKYPVEYKHVGGAVIIVGKKEKPKRNECGVEPIPNTGVFGVCSCGGDVLYYMDRGVRCKECGKLYGTVDHNFKKSAMRLREIVDEEEKAKVETELDEVGPIND